MIKLFVSTALLITNYLYSSNCQQIVTPVSTQIADYASYRADPVMKDFYGSVVEVNGDWYFVAAPGAGVVYGYHREKGDWIQRQVFENGIYEGIENSICVKSEGDWLFISTYGKSLKAQVQIYHLQKGVWEPSQTLGNSMGYSMDLDVENRWAIIGSVENKKAYLLKLEDNQWYILRTIANTDKSVSDENFGSVVAIQNGFAFISNGKLQNTLSAQTYVQVYKLQNDKWNYSQKLQSGLSSDSFGSALSISSNWAAVSAPLDNKGSGKVYIYKYKDNSWKLHSEICSDDTSSLLFGMNGLSLNGKSLFVGDSCHTGSGGDRFQGAIISYVVEENVWNYKSTIYHPSGSAYDFFGYGVASEEDLLLGGTMTALDQKFPKWISASERHLAEIDEGHFVPVISEGSTVLYKVKCK